MGQMVWSGAHGEKSATCIETISLIQRPQGAKISHKLILLSEKITEQSEVWFCWANISCETLLQFKLHETNKTIKHRLCNAYTYEPYTNMKMLGINLLCHSHFGLIQPYQKENCKKNEKLS